MTFYDFFEPDSANSLLKQLWDVSFPLFLPELVLCATIVIMLLVRLPSFGRKINASYLALAGSIAALVCLEPWKALGSFGADGAVAAMPRVEIFQGMLVHDGFGVFFRTILIGFAILFTIFTRISGIPDREDGPDFYTLVLGATLGMCLMATANHLMTVFLAVEMASVPSYVLAGMLKGRRQSSEAALKYSVYGAGAAGVMLYGISLVAGSLGTAHIPTLADQLSLLTADGLATRQMALVTGGLMIMVGLAFKLSAVPFHFWAPDVFEGASAEVGAFLSVASKAAALALLVRLAVGFSQAPGIAMVEPGAAPTAVTAATPQTSLIARDGFAAYRSMPERRAALTPVRKYIVGLVAFLAAITCTFGNLAAFGQTNMKRLLAYSTIAHAGYMMMPVAACVKAMGTNPEIANRAIAGMSFYVAIYLFMNLGAFAVVAFLRNEMRSEEIADYAGLIKRSPFLVISFGLILVSLLGLPPLAGFLAKYAAFLPMVEADIIWLLVIGLLNTVISLVYYLRVLKVMALDPEPEHRLPVEFSMLSAAGVFVGLMATAVVALFVWSGPLAWATAATQGFTY